MADDVTYLQAVLREQTFASDAPELEALQQHRQDVTALLKAAFGPARPTVRYGGSHAKGTMIRRAYDLDLPCYFAADEDRAGSSLKAIYENVEAALRTAYWTEPKASAIRLRSRDAQGLHQDFHIDVVPGRFFDETESDVWLYQNVHDRERLKTNLDTHIAHVRESGVRSAIRLMKLWRVERSVNVKNFVLELLTIDLLAKKKSATVAEQVRHVLEQLRDNTEDLYVEDPANPGGNDLSGLLNDSTKVLLQLHAASTLQTVDQFGWERVFGPVTEEKDRLASLAAAAAGVPADAQQSPWRRA